MSRLLQLLLLFFVVSCQSDKIADQEKRKLQVLTVQEFVRLYELIEYDNDQKFDELWKEIESRLYFTMQSKGIEYYSLEERYHMAHLLEGYAVLGSDYVIAQHSTKLLAMVSLLEWYDMFEYIEEHGKFLNADEWIEHVKSSNYTKPIKNVEPQR